MAQSRIPTYALLLAVVLVSTPGLSPASLLVGPPHTTEPTASTPVGVARDAGLTPIPSRAKSLSNVQGGPFSEGGAAQPEQLAVPLYVDPGSNWTTVEAEAAAVGFVVINPDSGPGSSSEPSYVAGVKALESSGIKAYGYVPTDYDEGGVSLMQAETWVGDYYAWYSVNGIFFDEASDVCNASTVAYYGSLYNYTKAEPGAGEVVLNPGTATGACYGTISDVLVTFEDTFTNYTTQYEGANWTSSYPSSHFWNIVYSVPGAASVPGILRLAHQRGAGWVFATQLGLPNPYGALPSFWAQEVAWAMPLSIGAPWADPNPTTVGKTTNLTANATGGGTEYAFDWSDLPAGCGSQNTTSLECLPTTAGNATVTVTVSDVEGAFASSFPTLLRVDPKSGTLASAYVTPTEVSLPVGGTEDLQVTVLCSGGPCPPVLSYAWSLLPTTLGSLNSSHGSNVQFTAGSNATFGDIQVNVSSESGASLLASVAATVEPVLASVNITQSEIVDGTGEVSGGGRDNLTAVVACKGGACPADVTFVWGLSRAALGTLNQTTGSQVSFLASNQSGSAIFYVNATLGNTTVRGSGIANVVGRECPQGGGGSDCNPVASEPGSPLFLYALVFGVAAVAVGVIYALTRRPRPRT